MVTICTHQVITVITTTTKHCENHCTPADAPCSYRYYPRMVVLPREQLHLTS